MNKQIIWNADQWATVRSIVQEEAARARVAANFLPLYGPLAPGARYVDKQALEVGANASPPPAEQLSVDASPGVWDLATLAINVTVTSAQMAEPGLVSAIQMFRRAANVIARLEDSVIFNGQRAKNSPPNFGGTVPEVKPRIYTVSGGGKYPSLLNPDGSGTPPNEITVAGAGAALGQNLVTSIAEAVGTLEANGHLGPFACVLDQKFFVAANSPSSGSMVLPSDRMTPFLGEAPLRSSTLPPKSGVVVALGGAPIDVAVAKDIDVQFLQVTTENKFVFRVSEKLVLRVKDPSAVVVLT